MKNDDNLLDLNFPDKGLKKVKIGELKQEVIDILNINRKPCNIIMWYDRLKYTEKHKSDFRTEEEYIKCMENIPNIIKNPDYVGLHPRDGSIQYIKQINELMLVGIRIKPFGEICYRSAYPITEGQLNNYIDTERVVRMNSLDKGY